MTTTTTTALPLSRPVNRRYNAKCKGCKRGASVFVVSCEFSCEKPDQIAVTDAGERLAGFYGSVSHGVHLPCACGKVLTLRPVLGIRNNAITCDRRCEHATGHQCECACGGKNHGKAHG